ncbi:hypothetical protein, partial [uncultured Bilophila sp.]|uniref:hypothetical protein n=1 Tax=uncultured Bilophila sp. TaxID=529385 RepID=UPI00280AA146
ASPRGQGGNAFRVFRQGLNFRLCHRKRGCLSRISACASSMRGGWNCMFCLIPPLPRLCIELARRIAEAAP